MKKKSQSPTAKETIGLFLGGASAGLIVFMLYGGWQVNHLWWVMSASMVSCSLLAVVFRQNFEKMLG